MASSADLMRLSATAMFATTECLLTDPEFRAWVEEDPAHAGLLSEAHRRFLAIIADGLIGLPGQDNAYCWELLRTFGGEPVCH